jgi:hypothetical protein
MEEFTINAKVLHELLAGASVGAANAKAYQQHLACVELVMDGSTNDVLRVAGTDGKKLVIGNYGLRGVGTNFRTLWHVNDVKPALKWLKGQKDNPVTVSSSLLKSGGEIIGLTPMTWQYPDVMRVIPSDFPTPAGDTMPEFVFDPELLADMAKVPNSDKRVNVLFNHVKRTNLAWWKNSSGVFWRYVFVANRG